MIYASLSKDIRLGGWEAGRLGGWEAGRLGGWEAGRGIPCGARTCNLKSGKLSLARDYSLADRKLKGKNNIVAENLYLGEKDPSETAVNAPVGLGLALLRDLKGVIDLDVGVAGDLDDPGISVSGIIAKAFLNIVTKAAASPFKLLGAPVGGDEDLGAVAFAAGETALTPETEARPRKLSEALGLAPVSERSRQLQC